MTLMDALKTAAPIVSAAAPLIGAAIAGSSNTGVNTSGADTAAQIAREQWDYYKQNYVPLEKALIGEAMEAGSAQDIARAQGAANADVTGAFNQAQRQMQSRLQSYGLNPASPAYQSAMGSLDLSQGAAGAGARTTAENRARDLGYAKRLDVSQLGRGIPAQSGALAQGAANTSANLARINAGLQGQQAENIGRAITGITPLIGKAAQWFGQPSTPTVSMPTGLGYGTIDPTQAGYGLPYASGGKVMSRYARGGMVGNPKLKAVMMKHGMPEMHSQMETDRLAARRNEAVTPHMRKANPRGFAMGGGVGRQGLEMMPDMSNMGEGATIDNATGEVMGPGTGMSDSVPATIEGQEPARLSDGEFVMNAEAVNMTGEELLAAINEAGLRKRQSMGLEMRR